VSTALPFTAPVLRLHPSASRGGSVPICPKSSTRCIGTPSRLMSPTSKPLSSVLTKQLSNQGLSAAAPRSTDLDPCLAGLAFAGSH
jgi:hypothetical protein